MRNIPAALFATGLCATLVAVLLVTRGGMSPDMLFSPDNWQVSVSR